MRLPNHWKLRSPDPALTERLTRRNDLHGVLATLLVNRGHDEPEAVSTDGNDDAAGGDVLPDGSDDAAGGDVLPNGSDEEE